MFDVARLSPEFRRKVRHLPSTTSTMDIAAQALRDGAEHGSVVVADAQTAGRGRRGRVWQTFPEHGLACTFVFTENTGPHLPLVVAVGILRAFKAVSPVEMDIGLKWPNDVLLNGRKLAGILVEKVSGAEGAYVVGIGLNLTRSPAMMESFPGITLADALPPGTQPPSREKMLETLGTCLLEVLSLYQGTDWPALAGEYVRNCRTIGQKVVWKKDASTEIVGDARGLDADGALELMDDTGTVHLIHSGDVIAQGQTH